MYDLLSVSCASPSIPRIFWTIANPGRTSWSPPKCNQGHPAWTCVTGSRCTSWVIGLVNVPWLDCGCLHAEHIMTPIRLSLIEAPDMFTWSADHLLDFCLSSAEKTRDLPPGAGPFSHLSVFAKFVQCIRAMWSFSLGNFFYLAYRGVVLISRWCVKRKACVRDAV